MNVKPVQECQALIRVVFRNEALKRGDANMRINVLVAAAVVVGGTVLMPTAAEAAVWNPIAGTVYEGGAWYRSSNIRYKELDGEMEIDLHSLPSGSNGVQWYLNGVTPGQPAISDYVHVAVTYHAYNFGWYYDRTGFQNNFKQYTPARGVGNYQFSGEEYY